MENVEEHFICNSSCTNEDCSGKYMYRHLSEIEEDKFKETITNMGVVFKNRYKKDDVVVSIHEFAQGIQRVSTLLPVAMGLGFFMYCETDRGFEEILYSMDTGYWKRYNTAGGTCVVVDKELAFMDKIGVQERLVAITRAGEAVLDKMLPEEMEKLKEIQRSENVSIHDLMSLIGGVVERTRSNGEEFSF